MVDLKDGQVVGAGAGAPHDVVGRLLGLFPFDCMFVTDLDAREGKPANLPAVAAIAAAAPGVELWIDSGISALAAASVWLAAHPYTLVIRSGAQSNEDVIETLRDEPRVLLSLDFLADKFQGPLGLHLDPGFWPQRLIVHNVADAGPNIDRLEKLIFRAGRRAIYAAGGVRNGEDLERVRATRAAGALVACALINEGLTHPFLVPPKGEAGQSGS